MNAHEAAMITVSVIGIAVVLFIAFVFGPSKRQETLEKEKNKDKIRYIAPSRAACDTTFQFNPNDCAQYDPYNYPPSVNVAARSTDNICVERAEHNCPPFLSCIQNSADYAAWNTCYTEAGLNTTPAGTAWNELGIAIVMTVVILVLMTGRH